MSVNQAWKKICKNTKPGKTPLNLIITPYNAKPTPLLVVDATLVIIFSVPLPYLTLSIDSPLVMITTHSLDRRTSMVIVLYVSGRLLCNF